MNRRHRILELTALAAVLLIVFPAWRRESGAVGVLWAWPLAAIVLFACRHHLPVLLRWSIAVLAILRSIWLIVVLLSLLKSQIAIGREVATACEVVFGDKHEFVFIALSRETLLLLLTILADITALAAIMICVARRRVLPTSDDIASEPRKAPIEIA
jgi:hypothetical protein